MLKEELRTDLKLKVEAREEVAKPKGEILPELQVEQLRGRTLIVVGDMVARSAIEAGLRPAILIIDLRVQRKRVEPPPALEEYEIIRTKNPPGLITKGAWGAVRQSIERARAGKKVAVVVEGEEDLLGFPAAYFAPEGSILLYGQPDRGVVVVHMSEKERGRVKRMLAELFEPASGVENDCAEDEISS